MDKRELTGRLTQDPGERLLLARLLDRMEAARGGAPAHSAFLSPREQALARTLLAQCGNPRHVFSGGYEGADRQVLFFLPDWQEPEDACPPDEGPIRCVEATFYEEYAVSHRDLLGALMGAGLARDRVGDLLPGEGRCQMLVLQEVLDGIFRTLDSAGRAKLKLQEVPLTAVEPPERQTVLRRDTVASPRLDAILASGFSLSRGDAAELCRSGKVSVNWQDCDKADRPLVAGDVISARGYGKFVLRELGSPTKKGRLPIVTERYV